MKTIPVTIYKFEELEEKIQEKVLNKYRFINVEYYDWYHFSLEEWKITLDNIGFENAKIQFSGFAGQGDGASFTADCNLQKLISHIMYCEKGFNKNLYKLYLFAENSLLGDGQLRRTNHHYSHEQTVHYENPEYYGNGWYHDKIIDWLTDYIEEIRRDLSQDIYFSLRKEYEYLTEDEQIKNTLEANEYTFLKNGTFFN